MSRFGRLELPPQPQKPIVPPIAYPSPRTPPFRPEVPRGTNATLAVQPNVFQTLCFKALAVYILSGYVNDLAFRLLQNKAYISMVAVCLIPVFFLFSGTATRGFQHPIGKLWLGFAVCVALSAPFSVWRGGTISLLTNYFPKAFVIYFYACAAIVSLRQVRSMMTVLLIGAYALLPVCFLYGSGETGRFSIPGSIFYSNANELGLQLLLNIIFFIYVFFANRNMLWKIASFAGIGLSAHYMLQTGSRGEFLGFLIVAAVIFMFSKRKLLFAMIGVPVICLSLFVIPAHTRHRLTYIFMNTDDAVVSSMADRSTLESQIQRTQLLLDSIKYSFQYPLFGVGAGQFAVRVAGDKEKKGEHPEWLGTHNTYTQISSETGLPAFVCYTLALILCVRMCYRLFRQTAAFPELKEHYAIAFCMFLCLIAYAFSTFFFHIAYSGYFPLIAGISVSNYLIARRAIEATRKL